MESRTKENDKNKVVESYIDLLKELDKEKIGNIKVQIERDYNKFLLKSGEYMVNKGDLTKDRYNYIIKENPNQIQSIIEMLIQLVGYEIKSSKMKDYKVYQLIKL